MPEKAIHGPFVLSLNCPLHYRKAENVRPFERKLRGAKSHISNPQIHYSFSGLSHAGLSGLPHYISSAHYLTAGRLFFHGTSLPTLNIFIIPLCVADELLWLCFYYWAECKRSDGDRKDERKQSKQFSSPASSRLQD